MTKIKFDEPSTGNVTGAVKTALAIETHGNRMTGLGIKVYNTNSIGISCENLGTGSAGLGIYAKGFTGIKGESMSNIGVQGRSNAGVGVVGVTNGNSRSAAGVSGINQAGGIGVLGTGKPAGRFNGDVEITGDIKLLNPRNADCAEDFDILEQNVLPGTVMVLTENGSLQSCHQEYDKKVAGVISGAGGYTPAMVLAREQQSLSAQNEKKKNRLPIALIGKVYCKVDARQSPIETGDLLTTSSTKGYAMKAEDPVKAFGTVLER
jgi:hypothetical protein